MLLHAWNVDVDGDYALCWLGAGLGLAREKSSALCGFNSAE